MLPIEFDHQSLASLPLVDEARAQGVIRLLKGIVARRVLPYFRGKAAADDVTLARVSERYRITRLEDLRGRIRTVSLLTHSSDGWTIHIHERVFDYISFGIPWDLTAADSAIPAPEGRKALAFAELLLRHELEHMIRPHADERDVILSDAEFAMDRRELDPAYYRTLREALGDKLGGLRGIRYLKLLDRFEREEPADDIVAEILPQHAERLTDVPSSLLVGAFRTMDFELKRKVIEACYRMSRNTSHALVHRSALLRKVLRLLIEQLKMDQVEFEALSKSFTDRWGVAPLLQEMGVSDQKMEVRDPEALFGLFVSRLREMAAEEESKDEKAPERPSRLIGQLEPHEALADSPRQSLKDRVADARKNPAVPRRVLEVIDKNQTGLKGHSAAKYTEFVETLLALPWGKLHPIDVGPKEFAAGLETSHYGLHRPKEIVTDFFSNLIWRYRSYDEEKVSSWNRTGSSFLFVGPPGVGKTSLAISIARNLEIPYHKVSLGGMRDESDLRGHGFTYEGSKPGAIVQGLVKMGVMNGMFILDEADKTEKFAIATLLEILDPEQNHLFHDKYTQTTVDINLSNCHFILTANTLETVPEPVIDRCQVVMLNRYSIEEKTAIARKHIIPRIRRQHDLDEEILYFEPGREQEHLRELVRNYTHEAGVRQLEWTLRTLFLRLQRREIFDQEKPSVIITHQLIKRYLEEPSLPRRINEDDRVGEVLALGVDVERGIGSVIPIQATRIRGASNSQSALSMVHATGNIEKVMDESRTVATTGILHNAEHLDIHPDHAGDAVHLHFMGGSTRKDGPSAGSAIAVALASFLNGRKVRRDVAITGEIDTHGRITGVGGLDVKLETAANAGCKTVIIPAENLHGSGGVDRFPEPLKVELQILDYAAWEENHQPFDYSRHVLQVVAVDHIIQAMKVAVIDDEELDELESQFVAHAEKVSQEFLRTGEGNSPNPQIVLVKETEEIGDDHFKPVICQSCVGCQLLVSKEIQEEITGRFSDLESQIKFLDLDTTSNNFSRVLSKAIQENDRPPVTVIAPFFTLKAGGFQKPDPAELKLLANNYAVQGIKLKRCKPLLNRTFCRMGHLGPGAFDDAPFLTTEDGITVVDLSLIPEKYRLLVPRAEEILNRCLAAWLEKIDRVLENRESVTDTEPVLSP